MQSQGLVDMLLNQFGGGIVTQISKRLGVDEQTARRALTVAIPLLVSALARNTSTSSGAQSLNNALERDHDGSILGQLGSLLGSASGGDGDGILRHTLGGQRSQVEQSLSNATGVDGSALLQMLAPIVMGQLGQVQRQQGLDADGVANVLNQEQRRQEATPGLEGLLNSILGSAIGDQGTSDSQSI